MDIKAPKHSQTWSPSVADFQYLYDELGSAGARPVILSLIPGDQSNSKLCKYPAGQGAALQMRLCVILNQ